MVRRALRLTVPWDVRRHWLETVALPALSIAASMSFIVVELLIARRAVPAMGVPWWALPLGLAILTISTYLGTLQYYLALPLSIRVLELFGLAGASGMAALRTVDNVGSLALTLAVVLGSWVMSMHMSFHLYRVWPALKEPDAAGTMRTLVERANVAAIAEQHQNLEVFGRSYRHILKTMGQVFIGSLLMSSLIRPDVPEPFAMKVESGMAMGVFVLSVLGALGATVLLEVQRESEGGRITSSPKLAQGWLTALAMLVAPVALAACLIPSGLAPYASHDLGGVASKLNGVAEDITRVLGGAFFTGMAPPETPTAIALMFGGGQGARVMELLRRLVESPFVARQWSVAQVIFSVIWAMLMATFVVVLAWLGGRAVVWSAGVLCRREFRFPPFPARELLALILWPVSLYRAIRWLLVTLSKALASWMAGVSRQANEQSSATLTGIARMFGLHAQAPAGIPKDPAAFIRFIFSRIVGLSRRYGGAGVESPTARDYTGALARRFPSVGDSLARIGQSYENVRYGSKTVDHQGARAVNDEFAAVRRGIRERRR